MSNQADQKKQTSTTTILSIFNSMIGGAMLTFPLLFKKTGIISSTIVLTVSGIISYITCRVLIFHMREEDEDVQSIIIRLLGLKWQKFWRFITSIYLMLLCIIYIDLITDQFYSVFIFFFKQDIARKDQFAWGKFSQQWLSIIMLPVFMFLAFIKNKSFLIRIASYGSYAVIFYFIFLVYQFIKSVASGDIDVSNINWFSFQVGDLAGTSGLAFTVHTLVVTLIKPNQKKQNNMRDLGLSYGIAYVFYMVVSLMGYMAIFNGKCKITLIDCYLDDWTVLIVEVSYFLSRLSIFPIILDVGRTRFLQIFQKDGIQPKTYRLFNIIYIIVGVIFAILSPYLPIPLVMNITGAVICYCFIYLFPTYLHFKGLQSSTRLSSSMIDNQTLISQTEEQVLQRNTGKASLVAKKDTSLLTNNTEDKKTANKMPKWAQIAIWTFFNVVGVAVGIYGLYTCIKSIGGGSQDDKLVNYWI